MNTKMKINIINVDTSFRHANYLAAFCDSTLYPHFINLLLLALTAVKDHVTKYSETDFSNSNVIFGP